MSSLATTTEAATRSPQSLASGGDDEGWWIYFRAEAPDGWPERARAEPVVAKLAKERPVLAAATEKRCGAGDAREVSSRGSGASPRGRGRAGSTRALAG